MALSKEANSRRKFKATTFNLERATIPIDFILASPKINVLHNILMKKDSALTEQVYKAQLKIPCKGDWSIIVKEVINKVGITLPDRDIGQMSKYAFKYLVKRSVKNANFVSLWLKEFEKTMLKTLFMMNSEFNLICII